MHTERSKKFPVKCWLVEVKELKVLATTRLNFIKTHLRLWRISGFVPVCQNIRLSTGSHEYWGIAKLVKAPDFDSGMRRFESFFPSHFFSHKAVEAYKLLSRPHRGAGQQLCRLGQRKTQLPSWHKISS